MAVHEDRAVRGKLLGDGPGLLRIALIVPRDQLQRLAENASLGVDVGDRRAGPGQKLRPEGGFLAGHRTRDRNDDFRLSQCGCGQSETGCKKGESCWNDTHHCSRSLSTGVHDVSEVEEAVP